MTVATLTEEAILLDQEELVPSTLNPRKFMDPAKLEEMASSIREHGVLVPLLVRPMFDGEDGDIVHYEIIAGQRRHAAARLIGPGKVPCIVRELSDAEAREIAIIDNLQREDMPALEEADAYEALRQQVGDAERIAARVGKPIEYVTRRLKLVSLGDLCRQALAQRLITIDHALLLTKLGPEEQNNNLKWALDTNAGIKESAASVFVRTVKRRDEKAYSHWGAWEPQSVPKLKNHIEQHTGRLLAIAPWDLADPTLVPAAGPCIGCPANTAANTALFSDLSIEEATCANGACFESKRAAFVEIKLAETFPKYHPGAKPGVAVRLSWKSSESAPLMDKEGGGVNIGKVLRYGQWLDVKKGSCSNVCDGVTVDWDESRFGIANAAKRKPGMVQTVCIAAGCKTHPKAYEKKAKGDGRQSDAAREAAQKKRVEAALAENKLRFAVASKAVDGVTKLPWDALRFLIVGAISNYGQDLKIVQALVPGVQKVLETAKVDSPEFAKAAAAVIVGTSYVHVNDYCEPDYHRKDFLATIKQLGFNGSSVWAAPSITAKKALNKAAVKKTAPAKKTAKKKVAVKKVAAKKAKAR